MYVVLSRQAAVTVGGIQNRVADESLAAAS